MNDSLAIIPARGGSKRIPRKNLKDFLGKPVIQYSIEAAIKSGCFSEVMVSTEDSEIAEKSRELGARIPFYRSRKNSDDYAGLADVIAEVLNEYKERGQEFKYCCCILPSAPLILSMNIKEGYRIIHENEEIDAVIPVVQYSTPIQRAFKIEKNSLTMMWPENYEKRSQDLEAAFHDSGQFYWLSVKSFNAMKKLYMDKTIPMKLLESHVQDIDTEEDWKLAEIKYRLMHEGK